MEILQEWFIAPGGELFIRHHSTHLGTLYFSQYIYTSQTFRDEFEEMYFTFLF